MNDREMSSSAEEEWGNEVSLSLPPSLPPGRSARLSPHVRFIKGEESGDETSLPPSLPPSLPLSLSFSPSPLSLPLPLPLPLSLLSLSPRRAALSQHSDSTTGVWTMTGARETRRQGREGAFGACGSGPNILILRYRHPAHAQNIVVSNHPELTQVCRVLSTFSPRSQLTRDSKVCRVLSTFSPRSQLTRDSKVCRVLSTFSPSSGGSSASNLLEPSPCVEFLPLQLPTTVS